MKLNLYNVKAFDLKQNIEIEIPNMLGSSVRNAMTNTQACLDILNVPMEVRIANLTISNVIEVPDVT